MAAKKSMPDDIDPLATLTDEARESLEKMQGDLDASYEYLKTMEELGLDVSRQRIQLDQAVKLRDAALKLFTKK